MGWAMDQPIERTIFAQNKHRKNIYMPQQEFEPTIGMLRLGEDISCFRPLGSIKINQAYIKDGWKGEYFFLPAWL
jgi:hypothetical protein